ncbi:hypothetical protein BS50DRAFT_511641 [Corynespora cassiicola Philippines]|uniref:Pre-mRNA-splicing factor rse1 n=1 Tax=Corynespora cassiicola Philippines TaxID=1448308 RepID=A0A2T2PB33_CORCC|nr:hypothetical protein BS50DRAFT_511641 [Corynespora cassiicola Philippines]
MTTFSRTSLYSLTVKPPSATQDAIAGDFLGSGKQQILTANGSRLSIIEVSRASKTCSEIFSQDVFGIIRRIAKFRLAGGTKDMIAISTDSGRMVTYEYMSDRKELKTIHYETYGKSGIRRVVPGEYLAVDPKGRAIMVASTEKNKLVYILTRSGETDVAISSPLEAHKPQTLVYNLIGLDVGYDNPLFAALELDYSSCETDPSGEAKHSVRKELVYYELDLGLNHIVRKWAEPVDRTAHILFRVPGGPKVATGNQPPAVFPSGVLCCGEDNISYRNIHNSASDVCRLAIPRREGATEDPNRKRSIVAGTLYALKGGDFFYLLQTEDGDLFKLTVDATVDGVVTGLKIKYFDTVPVARSICILRTGFVYFASESGDRRLYELESLGDDSDDPVFVSSQFPSDPDEPFDPPFFKPRGLKNLVPVEGIPSLNAIMDMKVANPAMEDSPQIYTTSGAGGQSSFRITKNALEVLSIIESPLPSTPSDVFTTKLTLEDDSDTLIVLGAHSSTTVLKTGEDVVEATGTGLLNDTNTLGVQQWGDDCLIQFHPRGIRHVRSISFPEDSAAAQYDDVTDWSAPQHTTIVTCASNNRQAAIALSNGSILYFECDQDGSLSMSEEHIYLDTKVNCLAIPEVPDGYVRANFMAVGCSDSTVRIYNVSPDIEGNLLESISVQALSAPPTGLAINKMGDQTSRGTSQYLHIGLTSGVYIRSVLDENTGDIGETRRRFLGPEPIRFATVIAAGDNAVLAMTSRPWLSYTHPTTRVLQLTPLDYVPFKSACNFDGEAFKGIICIMSEELRIFAFKDLIKNTTHEEIPLRYTPRKLIHYDETSIFFVVQGDNNTLGAEDRRALIKRGHGQVNGIQENEQDETDELPPSEFGYPKAQGRWASCIQVIDSQGEEKGVIQTIELQDNKTALSGSLVGFESRGEFYVAVGVAKDMSFNPFRFTQAAIQLYRVSANGRSLEFVHETEVPEPPLAMLAFKGKLVVGIGKDLCLYDCGMKSLLRKAMTPGCVQNRITGLKTQGSRLIVSDQSQSVTYVVHKDQVHPNRLIPFIDDMVPRYTTCTDMLDYDTVVGGDKFGNMWVVRCPQKVSEASDEPGDGIHMTKDKEYLGGTPNRLELVCHFFTNDIPICVQKTQLLSGSDSVIFWAGLQGTLGAMIPFTSRRQHKMFQQLELLLRSHDKPVSGRDHLAFRSYYSPVKGVIDGDLIERYLVLGADQRQSLAATLTGGWSSDSVDEAIWNMRALYAF